MEAVLQRVVRSEVDALLLSGEIEVVQTPEWVVGRAQGNDCVCSTMSCGDVSKKVRVNVRADDRPEIEVCDRHREVLGNCVRGNSGEDAANDDIGSYLCGEGMENRKMREDGFLNEEGEGCILNREDMRGASV